MDCVIVSHTHWDREWYRTFQAFRARLVDAVDCVLDLLDTDPGWSFVLDGQTIVLEDYLAIRPDSAPRVVAACRSGRLAIGPWYVQPDSLLPAGETHIRNLLEGRRVAAAFAPASTVAYTPDSFGHPSQFPQLFAGFGLDAFVYWRGNGDEIDALPSVYAWESPDGTSITACHLTKGYFAAAQLPDDIRAAVKRLRRLGDELSTAGGPHVLMMNGVDHALPDPHTAEVARVLAAETGWNVTRGRLEDYTESVRPAAGARFRGELVGGRTANLLPGVWSARLGLKLDNRRAETALVGWAEPWAALGRALGLPDERPALRLAWRALLANQAHDSIGGCSQDRVHEQMGYRFDEAIELADETTTRVLSRLAGLDRQRITPWTEEVDVAVFNPSPHPRTDLVRFPIEGYPFFAINSEREDVHPLSIASLLRAGITVDGEPARVVADEAPGRIRIIPEQQPWTAEWVAKDVPAFGWRRYRVAVGEASPDEEDRERTIATATISVSVEHDGTLTVEAGGRRYEGLLGVEDVGDGGDTYDFDPVDGEPVTVPATVEVTRRRHATGIQELIVSRTFEVPASIGPRRVARSTEFVPLDVVVHARLVPGVDRVDLDVGVNNTARDHRLRLCFPTGTSGVGARALTTLDIADRTPRSRDASAWLHRAPTTFAQQGWVAANGLTVVAPGLPEAEVAADGTIAITLVRAVGWLSRMDLKSRPQPAGPGLRTPGAQCLGTTRAWLALLWGKAPQIDAWDAELGFRAVPAGPAPILAEGDSAVRVAGRASVLSALKPAEDGEGVIVRVLNPSDEEETVEVALATGWQAARTVRLDETDTGEALAAGAGTVRLPVPPHALRTVRFDP